MQDSFIEQLGTEGNSNIYVCIVIVDLNQFDQSEISPSSISALQNRVAIRIITRISPTTSIGKCTQAQMRI